MKSHYMYIALSMMALVTSVAGEEVSGRKQLAKVLKSRAKTFSTEPGLVNGSERKLQCTCPGLNGLCDDACGCCCTCTCDDVADSCPTGAPSTAPTTGAPSTAPTGAPSTAPTASFTPRLAAKGQQCAAGHAIDDKTECEGAFPNFAFGGEMPSNNRPYGCFLTTRNNMVYYNPVNNKRKVWKGSKAICKGGDFVAEQGDYTDKGAKKGRNCADNQKIIDSAADCQSAANALGKSYKKSITSKARPAGCFFKGNKAWFNTRTTVYQKGRYGKFTGVCKA